MFVVFTHCTGAYAMDLDWLGIVFRWMHMLAAMVAVGGTIFMRVALVGAVQSLAEDQRPAFHEAIRSRWAKYVAGAILFLLVSGLYNFLTTHAAFKNAEDIALPKYYHPLFGVKFLLALGVFFIASSLAGRSGATEKFRRNRRYWLSVNLLLSVIIVCISGVLRMSHTGPNFP